MSKNNISSQMFYPYIKKLGDGIDPYCAFKDGQCIPSICPVCLEYDDGESYSCAVAVIPSQLNDIYWRLSEIMEQLDEIRGTD